MSIWSQIGIFILVWLGVGLIVGVKQVLIDKVFKYEDRDATLLEKKGVTYDELDEFEQIAFDLLFTNRLTTITVITLFGFVSFYADTKRTFKKRVE